MTNLEPQNQLVKDAGIFMKPQLGQFSLKELLFKYLSYLPFILLIFSISVGVGYVYVRYKEPVYKASAQILVKFEDTRQNLSESNDLIQRALRETKQLNIDNEVTKLKSLVLLKRVAEEGEFNIKVRNLGRFRSSTLYLESPVGMKVLQVKDSSVAFEIRFKKFNESFAFIDLSFNKKGLPDKIKYDIPVTYLGITFVLKKRSNFTEFEEPISIQYEPPVQTARKISGALSVGAVGKTSVIQIDIKDDNPFRAKEILDKLVIVFQKQDVEMKRIASLNTIRFINDRLGEVASEVDTSEAQIMSIKKKTLFNDIASTYDYSKARMIMSDDQADKLIVENEVINMLEEYIKNPKNDGRIVPVDLGIESSFLGTYLREYNNLNLTYEKERAQLVTPGNSKILSDIQLRLRELKYNVLEILKNLKQENKRKIDISKAKSKVFMETLVELPELEKKLKNIQTQATIKKELYLYLLKRKEEIGITSATFVSSYEPIDAAAASFTPVEPKTSNIRNFSMLIGLVVPILIIYLIDLFNDKVTLRDQILKKIDLPIAGEVSHVANPEKFVFSQSRSLVAEQFRILRSNLGFLFKGLENSKVILISSTISGEGKSFVSSNLAAAISVADKKVALLLFDLRKLNSSPVIDAMLQGKNSRGITNYLIGQVQNFSELKVIDEAYPNLHVYPAGPIPPNPAELLLSHNMHSLFKKLRDEYDFIVVDSAPAGLVSDSFILQEHVDITLYIIRQQYTLLKQLDFIAELCETRKLRNVSIVVNDVKMGGRYGYYGYNYGYGYSYSYKYGYGYGKNGVYGVGGYYTDVDKSALKDLPWWVRVSVLLRNIFRK